MASAANDPSLDQERVSELGKVLGSQLMQALVLVVSSYADDTMELADMYKKSFMVENLGDLAKYMVVSGGGAPDPPDVISAQVWIQCLCDALLPFSPEHELAVQALLAKARLNVSVWDMWTNWANSTNPSVLLKELSSLWADLAGHKNAVDIPVANGGAHVQIRQFVQNMSSYQDLHGLITSFLCNVLSSRGDTELRRNGE